MRAECGRRREELRAAKETRVRSLVEEQHFFDTHWLAKEGLIDLDRLSAMFGVFGLAECVNLLMAYENGDGERRAVLPWFYVGGVGFVVTALGCGVVGVGLLMVGFAAGA